MHFYFCRQHLSVSDGVSDPSLPSGDTSRSPHVSPKRTVPLAPPYKCRWSHCGGKRMCSAGPIHQAPCSPAMRRKDMAKASR